MKFKKFDVDGNGEVDEQEIRDRFVSMYEEHEKRQRTSTKYGL